MAELIFSETTFPFIKNTGDDIYCSDSGHGGVPSIVMTVGETYTVVWDGAAYLCTADATEYYGYNAVIIGNKSIDSLLGGGADTGEPFIIGYAPDVGIDLIETLQTGDTHTIAMYKGDATGGGGEDEDTTARRYLLENQQLAFSPDDETVHYCGLPNDTVSAPRIVAGNEYTVVWDGTEYLRTAREYSDGTLTIVTLGNQAIAIEGGEDTSEPFVYLYYSPEIANFKTLSTAESHVISIYERIDPTDIILYDKGGFENFYHGVETLSVDTMGGEVQYFSRGSAVDEEVVAPNFAEGDQVITATDADLMRKVVLQKPEALVPENIAKDVDLFGIVGTHQGGGGESLPPSDINFYDYDGTIVAAWTLEELAAATALPSNPEHEGLISQGWNWSLEDLKSANRPMNVGQMYITDDGKTRLYISIKSKRDLNVTLFFTQTAANGITLDWGDGSAVETNSSIGKVKISHAYAFTGEYVITFEPADGCEFGLGSNGDRYTTAENVIGIKSVATNNYSYADMLRKVEIGANMTRLNGYAFGWCETLATISLPASIRTVGPYVFRQCKSVRAVIIPNGVTSLADGYGFIQSGGNVAVISLPSSINALGDNIFYSYSGRNPITIPDGITIINKWAFNQCNRLPTVHIPSSVETIIDQAFGYNYCLSEVTIPANVKSIGAKVFNTCSRAVAYHLKPTTPPTLANTDAFSSIPSDCVFYVPKGSLSAYKSATNWSTYASYMQEEVE